MFLEKDKQHNTTTKTLKEPNKRANIDYITLQSGEVGVRFISEVADKRIYKKEESKWSILKDIVLITKIMWLKKWLSQKIGNRIINGMKTDQPPIERNGIANQRVTFQPL